MTKLVVGLGNPGEKYAGTRHNAGFMALDLLAKRGAGGEFRSVKKFAGDMLQMGETLLVKPTTFMNESGLAVAKICHFYQIKYQDMYVVHDDLDIVLGKYKMMWGKGPQVHNGLLSIERELGTDQFWNVRVGVENRTIRGNRGIPGVEYSLQRFTAEEKETLDQVLVEVVEQLVRVVS